jgi:hypothetical protein
MPAVTGVYGLLPINLIGGQPFAGSTRLIPITSGSGTSIFFGDVVKLTSTGTIEKDTGTSAATPVGVFLGCSFTDPTFGKTFRQYFPASTVAADIVGYVVDDPDTLFKVAVVSATTVITTGVGRSVVGNNGVLVQNAGNTATGNSGVALSATTATTATFPVRVIDVVPESSPNAAPASFTEVIVKWNFGIHQYENATGI